MGELNFNEQWENVTDTSDWNMPYRGTMNGDKTKPWSEKCNRKDPDILLYSHVKLLYLSLGWQRISLPW